MIKRIGTDRAIISLIEAGVSITHIFVLGWIGLNMFVVIFFYGEKESEAEGLF